MIIICNRLSFIDRPRYRKRLWYFEIEGIDTTREVLLRGVMGLIVEALEIVERLYVGLKPGERIY